MYNVGLNYLSRCDLANKYVLSNIYKAPKLNKIVFHLSLKDLLYSSELRNMPGYNSNIKFKGVFIFYILFFLYPKAKHFMPKSNIELKSKEKGDFILECSFLNKNAIDSFLFDLVLENNRFFTFSNNFTKLICSSNNKKVSYNTTVSLDYFKSASDLFNLVINGISSYKLKIGLNIIYGNMQDGQNISKQIKNISFFG